VNKTLLSLALALVWAGTSPAIAQRSTGPQVAIIDMGYVFKHHERFIALSDDMKRDIEQAEADLKVKKDSLRKLGQQLDGLTKGTDDFRQLEEDLAKQSADLQLKVSMQKKDFVEREARNHFDVYQEIVDRVKYHAEKSGITLVLRFNGDPIDSTSPDEILRGLNSLVVYNHPTIDITPVVLDDLNKAAPNPRGDRGPVGTRPKQGVPRPQ